LKNSHQLIIEGIGGQAIDLTFERPDNLTNQTINRAIGLVIPLFDQGFVFLDCFFVTMVICLSGGSALGALFGRIAD
jgi:hypothetical protein